MNQKYAKVSDLAKIFGMNRVTAYRRIDEIRAAGKFNDICIQTGPRKTLVNIGAFEEWLKSQHMKWLRA